MFEHFLCELSLDCGVACGEYVPYVVRLSVALYEVGVSGIGQEVRRLARGGRVVVKGEEAMIRAAERVRWQLREVSGRCSCDTRLVSQYGAALVSRRHSRMEGVEQ